MEAEIAVQTAVITVPDEIVVVRQTWVTSKKEELTNAEQALVALKSAGATSRKIQRVQERINLLRKIVRALEAGFLPIPRFDAHKLRLDQENLPLKAVLAIENATAQKLFDEFRIITGRNGQSGRTRRRDPLIVGVVRTRRQIHYRGRPGDRYYRTPVVDVPAAEEHFLVAWWRPEDLHQTDSY